MVHTKFKKKVSRNSLRKTLYFWLRVDFSAPANVTYLRSNCAAGELCFFEADTGMFIPAASRLKDVKWHSLTCPLGWAVQGTHAAQNDGSRVTAVDCPLASARPSLAVGDNFGRVRLLLESSDDVSYWRCRMRCV